MTEEEVSTPLPENGEESSKEASEEITQQEQQEKIASQEPHVEDLTLYVNSLRQHETSIDNDTDAKLRLADLQRARMLRNELYRQYPYGIFGLYQYLADLRVDVEWTQDAAWRRQAGLPYLSWLDFWQLHKTTPPPRTFTWIFVFVSTILLVVSIGLNGWTLAPLKVNPMLGTDPTVLIQMGALEQTRIVVEGEWWRLITPMVLHAGIIHYLINMVVLFFLGSSVERVHGSTVTALVFCVSAVGGNLCSANVLNHAISVGASGGIFGLLGVCLVDIGCSWKLLTMMKDIHKNTGNDECEFRYGRVFAWLLVDVLINVMIGFTPFLDNFSHCGGLFYGICLGLAVSRRLVGGSFLRKTTSSGSKRRGPSRRALRAVVGVLLAVSLFLTTAILLFQNDDGNNCKQCRYVSCIPFPFWKDDKFWYCDSCDMVEASLFTYTDRSEVDMICPYGEIITIELEDPNPDLAFVRSQLAGYCRAYCDTE